MKKLTLFWVFLVIVMPISLTMNGCGKSVPEGAPTTEKEIEDAAIKAADEDASVE